MQPCFRILEINVIALVVLAVLTSACACVLVAGSQRNWAVADARGWRAVRRTGALPTGGVPADDKVLEFWVCPCLCCLRVCVRACVRTCVCLSFGFLCYGAMLSFNAGSCSCVQKSFARFVSLLQMSCLMAGMLRTYWFYYMTNSHRFTVKCTCFLHGVATAHGIMHVLAISVVCTNGPGTRLYYYGCGSTSNFVFLYS